MLPHGAESVSNSAPSAIPSAKCSVTIVWLSGISLDMVWDQPVFYAQETSGMLLIVFTAWGFLRCPMRCAIYKSRHMV